MPDYSVFIYVQNLLGIGHLRRAAAIARALADSGARVFFVSGGMPIANLDVGEAQFYQLPPTRSVDKNFKSLVDEKGIPIDDSWRKDRANFLAAIFEKLRPDILLTELFPFGRRQFRFELIPLLQIAIQAKWKPKIVCSMRDILVTKPRLDRNIEIVDTLTQYYDKILVHGDERLISLAQTFPMLEQIEHLVQYTGYVLNPTDITEDKTAGKGEIVVSFGGGAVGGEAVLKLFKLRQESLEAGMRWRFIMGPHMPKNIVNYVQPLADENTIIETTRPDLPNVIGRAKISISQAGYNTIAEVLSSKVPAIIIPFEGGVETEQRLRSDLLAKKGLLQVIYEKDLTAKALRIAIERASKTQPIEGFKVSLDGAKNTANILSKLL